METKSRYEVLAELESKKRDLMANKLNLPEMLRVKESEIKMIKRQLEDREEEYQHIKILLNKRTQL